MSKPKDWKQINKIIINSELLCFWIIALVFSSYYFAKDYSNFMVGSSTTEHFWLGFLVLSCIIIAISLILSFSIAIVLQVKKYINR